MQSSDSVKIRDLAHSLSSHGIKIGQNKLFEKLRDWKFIEMRSTEVIQLSQPMTIQITNGDRSPSPRTAKRICEALEVQFDDIFEIVKPSQTAAK